jgi:hypothetical protein
MRRLALPPVLFLSTALVLAAPGAPVLRAAEDKALAPASAPGVVTGRPRLFLPDRRLPEVSARARGSLQALYTQRVKKDCDVPCDERHIRFTISNPGYLLPRILALLTCYRLEKEAAYKDKALAIIDAVIRDGPGAGRRDQRIRLQTLAIAYDWLHDELSGAEREKIRGALVAGVHREEGVLGVNSEFVSGHSHFTTASLVIALLALAGERKPVPGAVEDGKAGFAADQLLARALAHWEKYVDVARYVAADGGHHLGWAYGRSYTARLVWLAEALTTATGRDVFDADRAWLSQLGYHLVYGYLPDHTYFRSGDAYRDIDINLDDDHLQLAILAARYRDPHLAWFADQALSWCLSNNALAPNCHYIYPLLFHRPELPRRGPEDLPRARAFRRAGNYIMRSGWGAGDTALLLRAMPWYHLNHERRDFGSFYLYHRGGLAIHGGLYGGGDEDSEYGGSHLTNYAWRTIAHNSITVFDPAEKFCNPFTRDGRRRCEGEDQWSNDGGQRFRSTRDELAPVPHAQPRNAAEIEDPAFAQGSVPVFEDTSDFTYLVAQGAPAYRPGKVELFARHVLFLKKVAGWKNPVVVIHDQVRSGDPSFKKTWHLHTLTVPRRQGNVFVIENPTRVRFTGGVEARPRDYWHQYAGKLHLETVLPRDAAIEFVGGVGKEFWVNGRNYAAQAREMDLITEPGVGRIEVSPPRPSASDLFLHVLSPADLSDLTPRPEAKLLAARAGVVPEGGDPAVIGVRVANYALLLAGSGERSPEAPVEYEVPYQAPLVHLVTGLAPGRRHSARRDGVAVASGASSAGGVLTFRTPGGGSFRVAPD